MFGLTPLPRTLEACYRDLSSRSGDVRRGAMRDLSRHALGSDEIRARAVQEFAKLLTHDEEASVRSDAATLLADLAAVESLPALLLSLEDAHPIVRQMALAALGELGDRRALPRIERAATDARPEMRYQAALALARMLDGDELEAALLRACSDEDPNVRYIGLRLTEEQLVRPSLREKLRSGTSPLAKKVAALAAGNEQPLNVIASMVLARTGDTTCVPQLLRAARREVSLAREDEEGLYELLGALRIEQARPILEARAWGVRSLLAEGPALAARIGLARLGDDRARKGIEEDLASSRTATKTRGAVAAGRARLRHLRGAIETSGLDPGLVRDVLLELDREDL